MMGGPAIPSGGATRCTSRTTARSTAERALAERMLAAVRAGADVRTRKVRRLRAAIKVRAYENELKLTIALERMRALAREGEGAAAVPTA